MPSNPKIEAIREKCIEANPDILKLEVGCDGDYDGQPVKWLRYGMDFQNVDGPNVHVWQKGDGGRFVTPDYERVKIIGRPIRLADVLFTMTKTLEVSEIAMEGWLQIVSGEKWNLKQDDLTLQSEETIDFLYNLLK